MVSTRKVECGSGNVFLDLGFGKAEAENSKLRSELMMRIGGCCKARIRTARDRAEDRA